MSRNRSLAGALSLLISSLLLCPALVGGAQTPVAPGSEECEYGITLALLGRPAAAESVFTSLLSHSAGDPRALNNLGDLALLRGEAELALAFFDRAQTRDSADAGIVLNQATALLLLGEEELATARAAEGARLAGGARAAAVLLGLRYRDATPEIPKAEQHAYVGKEEVLTLLRSAEMKVPADTSRVARAAHEPPTGTKKKRTWRSAGPRAGTDPASLVYWKR